jgi:hypothetical protein
MPVRYAYMTREDKNSGRAEKDNDLQQLGLSARAFNVLDRRGIVGISDLTKDGELNRQGLDDVDPELLAEIKSKLFEYLLKRNFPPQDNVKLTPPASIDVSESGPAVVSGLPSTSRAKMEPLFLHEAADPANQIETLGLSRRAYNLLKRANIHRISQLKLLSDEQILALRGSGPTTLVDIKRGLKAYDSDVVLPPEPNVAPTIEQKPPDNVKPNSPAVAGRAPPPVNLRHALDLAYGLTDDTPLSSAQIAVRFGVPVEQVQQLLSDGLGEIARDALFQARLDTFKQAVTALGGLAILDEVRLALEAIIGTQAKLPGVIRLLKAVGTPIVIFNVHECEIVIIDQAGEWKYFEYLERAGLTELRRYNSTYSTVELLKSLKRRVDYPAELPDALANAFMRIHPMFEKQANGTLGLANWAIGSSEPQTQKPNRLIDPPRVSTPKLSAAPVPTHPTTPASTERFKKLSHYVDSLETWEQSLSPKLRRVELIGEIPLSPEQCAEIGNLLGERLQSWRPQDAIAMIDSLYSATFVCFLVGQGVFGYDTGDYWSAVEHALGMRLDGAWKGRLGQLLEKILKRRQLPLFPEMRESAARYMSLILAHGGIPTYCLRDYFLLVIKPSLRPIYAQYPPDARLDEVLSHYMGDRPVKYFLENGGNVALDFYVRSCELMQEWLTTSELPSAETVGLPEHVVTFFGRWAPEALKSRVRERDSNERLQRPELIADPWGSGLVLRLPSQRATAANDTSATWTVEPLNRIIPVHIRFGKTTEYELAIRAPQLSYTVSFTQGEKTTKWAVEGYRRDEPIMVFQPGSGRWQPRLTSQELWVFFSQTSTLSPSEGEAILAEELPDFQGGWRGQGWDLTQAQSLLLQHPERHDIHLGVRAREAMKPSLSHESQFLSSGINGQISIYVGHPPNVRIPLTSSRSSDSAELERWAVAIRQLDHNAQPIRISVSEINQAALSIRDNLVEINLADPGLLGPAPFGTYSIKVSGPMGRDAHFVIGCLPELQTYGIDNILVPEAQKGPLEAVIQIELSSSEYVELVEESRRLSMRQIHPGKFEIRVPGDTHQIQLSTVRALDSEVEQRVPLTLTLRRLKWRLVGGEVSSPDWTGQTIRMPLTSLLDEPNAALLIDIPGVSVSQTQLNIRLLNVQREVIVTVPIRRNQRATCWRFEPASLHDTLRSQQSPILRFELVITGLENNLEPVHLPVLDVTRDLIIDRLQAYWQKADNGRHLRVTWREEKPVRSRVLQFWPVWQPWKRPIEMLVPDSAQGEAEFFLPDDQIVSGHYRLIIAANNPWATAESAGFPPDSDSNTFDLRPKTPEDRLVELDTVPTLDQAFAHDLERAYILLSQDALDVSEIGWCCNHLDLAGPHELTALCRLVDGQRSETFKTALGSPLFEPHCIARVGMYYDNGDISESDLEPIIRLAGKPGEWSIERCIALSEGPYTLLRIQAVRQLANRDLQIAIPILLKLVSNGLMSEDEFIQLSYSEKYLALDELEHHRHSVVARRLSKLLEGSWSLVRQEMWLECDAGYGQIKRIEDPEMKISVEQFFEDEAAHILHVALHIWLDPEWHGETATINMVTREINFPRARKLFVCVRCGFASSKLDFYRAHLQIGCGGPAFVPPQANHALPLTKLRFTTNAKRPIQ